jgi:hypothetical protein
MDAEVGRRDLYTKLQKSLSLTYQATMNSTATDALMGVNIQNFVDNPNPNKNMRVYFSITPREG